MFTYLIFFGTVQNLCPDVYSGADFWQNRGSNDKSVKTSKNVSLDLLNKIGYGPIA